LETQIQIASDLHFLVSAEPLEKHADRVFDLLPGLIAALQRKREERRETREA
jgi:hypothetical protein